MPPNGGGCGGWRTFRLLELQSVPLLLVMSATITLLFLTNSPLAWNATCCWTSAAVDPACGTRLAVGVAVGVLGVAASVGVGGAGVPAPITIVSSAKPRPGPGLGQTPGSKFPNAS